MITRVRKRKFYLSVRDSELCVIPQPLLEFLKSRSMVVMAKLISILSLVMVLASTVGMCLNTFEWIQAKDVNGEAVDNPYLSLIEAVCISYFSVEFLLR